MQDRKSVFGFAYAAKVFAALLLVMLSGLFLRHAIRGDFFALPAHEWLWEVGILVACSLAMAALVSLYFQVGKRD